MNYTKCVSVFATVVGLSYLGFSAGSQPATARQSPPPGSFSWVDIPAYLRGANGVGTIRSGFQAGVVELDAVHMLFSIDWTASAVANQPPNYSLAWDPIAHKLGSHSVSKSRQNVPRAYFPTAACVIDASTLLVAGVTSTGKVLVESITLVWPVIMPAPITDPITGESSVFAITPSIGRAKRLYEGELIQGGFVRCLSRVNRDGEPATEALLLMDESNNVFTMKLSDGVLELLASPVDSTAKLGLVSLLVGKDQTAIQAMDHKVAGLTYTFRRDLGMQPSGTDPSIPTILILVDSNRDGTLESFLELSPDDYWNQKWYDLGQYDGWWLY